MSDAPVITRLDLINAFLIGFAANTLFSMTLRMLL
jgi:hypothetical protein